MGSIQGGIAKVAGSNDNLAIAIPNAQTIVIQCREKDAFMAYSEGGLQQLPSRLKLSQFENTDGTQSSGLVLTFPHSPFSGTLWFQSTSGVDTAEIVVWTIECAHNRMQGGY